MARYQGAHRAERPRNRRARAAALLGVTSLVVALFPHVPLLADGGDFSLDFAAAAPFSYESATGGGAWDDGTIGKSEDVVESLNGSDFACEDVVTYLTQIVVDDTAVGAQTIELDFSFAASPTGQDGVGHTDILDARVNYGPASDLIEGPHLDTGLADDGESVATLISEALTGTLFTGKSEILGTVQVTDLEPGETVILRIDTRIDCDDDPTTNPTGELQAAITAGRVTLPGADAVRVGRQTIPFKNLDEIAPAHPGLAILKSAGSDTVPEPGGTVNYRIEAFNTGDIGLTLDSLVDDRFGDLTSATATTCTVPQTIRVGGSYACAFDGEVTGNAGARHVNVVTGSAIDDEGTRLTDSDDASVTVADVPPTVVLAKSASPGSRPEPGGVFTFGLTVTNTSLEAVTITGLTDTNVLSPECEALVGASLAAGDSVSCSYTVTHTDPGSYLNSASVTVVDDDGTAASGSDDATVTVADVPPTVVLAKSASPGSRPEPGGVFTFGLTVTNTSLEAVTITGLTDTNVLSPECEALVGASLAAGDSVSCSYTVTHTDPGSYLNSASVTVVDDDGTAASGSDDATVTVVDGPVAVSLDKSVAPAALPEPGGVFTFGLTVTNTSLEAVTITGLTDTNVLSPECEALVGASLAAGDSVSCSYTVTHTDPGSYLNSASVTVVDDEQNQASDSDEATAVVTDVASAIELVKTASPARIAAPGGKVTFAVTVTNLSSVDQVRITSLTDDIHGNLDGRGDCVLPQLIPAGGSYLCAFSAQVTGNSGVETDTVTARGVDDDDNPVSASDSATVRIKSEDGPDGTDLSTSKTGPAVVFEGDTVTYTVSVTNSGPLTEPNAVAVDTLPDSFAFVAVQSSQGSCVEASGEITCALGSLAPAASAVVTVVARTTRFGNYVNVVVVEGDVLDDNPGNNVARAATDVVSVLPQVITTTTTGAPPETLPFTGPGGGSAGGIAAALLALGALILWAGGRRREPEAAAFRD